MTKLKEIIGKIKDKASQGKAALILSNSNHRAATLSLLRATTHDPSSPPNQTTLSTLLSSADGPRAKASAAVDLLLRRLRSTHNSAVALKCLLATHHLLRNGTFILQDQLSAAYPYSRGGANYLNLSHFRDKTTPTSWYLSSWVRFYAHHIENILCASRTLGFFLSPSSSNSSSPSREESREERVSGLSNGDLLRETDALVTVIEGIGNMPNFVSVRNKLVDEVVALVEEDAVIAVVEVLARVNEFKERIGWLTFGERLELVCAMKRLEKHCRESSVIMEVEEGKKENKNNNKKLLLESVRELKEKVGEEEEKGENKRVTTRNRETASDRFSGRVVDSVDLVRFPSARFLS